MENHPSNEKLAHFLSGKLSEAERFSIEHHVLRCDECCRRFDSLQEDGLSVLVRESGDLFQQADQQSDRETPSIDPETGLATLPPQLAGHSRYEVLERVNQGGMGDVFKARHRVMDRIVAIKVIRPELVAVDRAIQRFQNEVKAAARLAHPNIVSAFDAEEVEGLHLLVMEYIHGETIQQHIQRYGPMDVSQACGLIRQAALGLQHAYENGLTHRDIKPSNLILLEHDVGADAAGQQYRVKILDFGLARLRDLDSARITQAATNTTESPLLTREHVILGTPGFIAPEQLQRPSEVDIRADIYSLGCTLWYMISGQAPLLRSLQRNEPGDDFKLLADHPGATREFISIHRRMTALHPADRYQTPGEVVAAIDELDFAASKSSLSAKKTAQRPLISWRSGGGVAAGIVILFIVAWVIFQLGPFRQRQPAAPSDADRDYALFILPSRDLWLDDYQPIRDHLEQAGVVTKTASSDYEISIHPQFAIPAGMKADHLVQFVKAEHYDLIIVCGGSWSELHDSAEISTHLDQLLHAQLAEDQVVAAIGAGQEVLGTLGMLDHRRAARPPDHVVSPSWNVDWVTGQSVVVDGSLLTARDPDDAMDLAEELVRQLKGH